MSSGIESFAIPVVETPMFIGLSVLVAVGVCASLFFERHSIESSLWRLFGLERKGLAVAFSYVVPFFPLVAVGCYLISR